MRGGNAMRTLWLLFLQSKIVPSGDDVLPAVEGCRGRKIYIRSVLVVVSLNRERVE